MIRIQNIYYMLAYAFQTLREQGYCDMATEEFDNTADLCAAILIRGIDLQLKRGLNREYIDKTQPLSSLRGKIEVCESLKTRSILRRQLVCNYDEFSIDTQMNRIIKATCIKLLGAEVSRLQKKEIRHLLVLFSDVSNVDLLSIDWHMSFNRNNQTYRMLMGICWLVCKGLLQTQEDGSSRIMGYLDDQRMCHLYEKFILEYYRQDHPELIVSAPYISWALDDGFDDMLPTMKSDVVLTRGTKTLIIDAKYYSQTIQQQFNKQSIHSANLYQIFAYVKNKEAELAEVKHEVAGVLLYAKTDEDVRLDGVYQMSGNKISVKTLDLNCDFKEICEQLDEIAATAFSNALGFNNIGLD